MPAPCRQRKTVETGLARGLFRVTQRIGGEPAVPGRESFPRRERLTSPREFRDVFEHGRKAVGKAFVCYVVRRQGQGRKLGMAVSRKVGGAVTRNRIKRYIREFYRTTRNRLDEDTRIVVVARPAAADLSHAACHEALRQVIRRGGAFSE